MPATYLFGNKITPACKYCRESVGKASDDSVLCKRHGVVAPEHSCRHFYYDPLLRVPKRPVTLEKFDEKAFSIDE